MTISEMRRRIARDLDFTGEGGAEAAEILSRITGLSYSELILRGNAQIDGAERVAEITELRRSGMPLAYALNSKHFCGMDFYVDQSVLIPRADSECVASEAVRIGKLTGCGSLLDMCCGSGCLGIAVANGCGAKRAAFADISRQALTVARKNAAALLDSAEAEFYAGDLFDGIEGKFDLIVCNPPYISTAEYAVLEPQVKDFEPKEALLGGDEGTEFYRRICRQAGGHLITGGALVFEIGCAQSGAVQKIMRENGLRVINSGCDIAGRPRFVSGAILN